MKNLLTFVLFFVAVAAMAQTGTISGQIISEDGITLPGATVRLADTAFGAISDVDGEYRMTNVPVGDYTLTISYIGYNTVSQPVSVTAAGTTANFTLSPGIELNSIIVVGQNLQGISRALNQQKNNENITNVVSADQMGRFPDANIGDAMKRISGVTMQNDQGEARNIFIRGIAPQYNSVTLNGDRIPSAEGDNRNVQMDLIPADMIQLVEVNKALTPEMDGDAIGGSVNLVTRTATSEPRISLTFAPGYSPIREQANWTGGLVAGKRFLDNKLGVVFTGAYNRKDYGSDNFEVEYSNEFDDESVAPYISEYQVRKYDVIRKRVSGGLDVDYKFNANHQIRFKTLVTNRKDWENRFRLTYKDVEPDGFIGEIRRETKGGINNDDVKNRRLENQNMKKFGLDGEHTFGKLSMDWGVSYSDASEERPNERYLVYRSKDVEGSVTNLNSDFPVVQAANVSASDFEYKEMTEEFKDTKEENVKAKFKFSLPIMEGANKSKLKFGYTYKNKTKNRNNTFTEYDVEDAFPFLSNVTTSNQRFNNENLPSSIAPGSMATNTFLGDINVANFDGELVYDEFVPGNYDAEEDVNAGFIQYNQKVGDKWSFIAGGRYEATTVDYNGNLLDLNKDEDEAGFITATNQKSDYSNFLPSIHANFRPKDNAVIRLAWTNSIARPNYFDLVPYQLIDDDEKEIGNPDLEAAESMNLDLMGEYYMEEIGLVSFGAFYKNIDKFFYERVFEEGEFDVTQPQNGEEAKVYGFETSFQRQLDFLGDFMGRFNFYGNYTYTDSDADLNEDRTDLALAGTAPHLLNASLAYEDNRFNGRLSYNYTSDYVDEYSDNTFEDVFYDKSSFLDFNANYLLKDKWTIFAEAKNLTNQPLRYYQGEGGQDTRPYQTEYYQPTYNLGVKFDF